MKDFLLSESGDISFESDDLQLVSEENEISQSVLLILSIRLKEFKLDETVGLEDDNMLGKNFHEEYLKQDIIMAISEQEPRIASVETINMVKTARNIAVTINMKSQSNEEIEVSFNVG